MGLYSMATVVPAVILLTIATFCMGEDAQTVDALISTIRQLEGEAARMGLDADRAAAKLSRALARLPREAPSDARAQEAMIAHFRAMDTNGQAAESVWARVLAHFDGSFSARVLKELKNAQSDRNKGLYLLTIALMRQKTPEAAPAVAALLRDKSFAEYAGTIRMILLLFGYESEQNAQWVAQQIDRRTKDGEAAINIAACVGLGSAVETKPVRTALARRLTEAGGNHGRKGEHDDHDDEWLVMPAIALAISGCDDRQTIGRVEELFARTKGNTDSTASLYYAYALSWMDKSHARDYWRFILGRLGGEDQGRTGNAAMMVFLISLPDSAGTVITALANDPEHVVRKGAKEAAKSLRIVDSGKAKAGSTGSSNGAAVSAKGRSSGAKDSRK